MEAVRQHRRVHFWVRGEFLDQVPVVTLNTTDKVEMGRKDGQRRSIVNDGRETVPVVDEDHRHDIGIHVTIDGGWEGFQVMEPTIRSVQAWTGQVDQVCDRLGHVLALYTEDVDPVEGRLDRPGPCVEDA